MKSNKKTSHGRQSVGFTLVEMLVAVALVLLMMSLFAQVFQLAGGTITKQRGIAENDQRSRTFQNVITSDLNNRTFRMVMPWSVGEDGSLAEVNAGKREGYFYISENDPLNDLDDEIQLTVKFNAQAKNQDLSWYYGKATTSGGWTSTDTSQTPNVTFLNFANQPEADDGWTIPNGTAEAPAAEVAYFVRGGKLYRRILLIRRALPVGSRIDGQPTFNDGRDAFDYTVPTGGGTATYPDPSTVSGVSFWNDFDHSAFGQRGAMGAVTELFARFHSAEDLNNASTNTQFPLGRPNFRFGHRTDTGRPREFDSSGNYFGRFTHEETSHFNFRYPQGLSTLGNPMSATINMDVDPTTNPLTDNTFPDFAFGSRRGEDLLLSNVHGFDVKVWDPGAIGGAGAFVDIGREAADADVYNPAAVDYALISNPARLNGLYGPRTTAATTGPAANRVFDTWFPYAHYAGAPPLGEPKMDLDGDTFNDNPPFRSVIRLRGTGAGQYPEYDPAEASYAAGDSVFPSDASQRGNGLRFSYRCVSVLGSPGAQPEPTLQEWPSVAGGRIQIPANNDTNHIIWEAVDNWKPLRAIQITVRFYDETSEQMRQQTIVHSLVD